MCVNGKSGKSLNQRAFFIFEIFTDKTRQVHQFDIIYRLTFVLKFKWNPFKPLVKQAVKVQELNNTYNNFDYGGL